MESKMQSTPKSRDPTNPEVLQELLTQYLVTYPGATPTEILLYGMEQLQVAEIAKPQKKKTLQVAMEGLVQAQKPEWEKEVPGLGALIAVLWSSAKLRAQYKHHGNVIGKQATPPQSALRHNPQLATSPARFLGAKGKIMAFIQSVTNEKLSLSSLVKVTLNEAKRLLVGTGSDTTPQQDTEALLSMLRDIPVKAYVPEKLWDEFLGLVERNAPTVFGFVKGELGQRFADLVQGTQAFMEKGLQIVDQWVPDALEEEIIEMSRKCCPCLPKKKVKKASKAKKTSVV